MTGPDAVFPRRVFCTPLSEMNRGDARSGIAGHCPTLWNGPQLAPNSRQSGSGKSSGRVGGGKRPRPR
jgi:hypothetical protein